MPSFTKKAIKEAFIKLLEQIARHQRQRKTEQSAENRTMGQVNIHNKGILLSLHRIV